MAWEEGDREEREEGFEGTREEMERAMRRLDVLEWLILGFAILVALLGGAAVAFLVSVGTELPFRPTWAVLSILLLAIPGIFVFGRETRRSKDPGRSSTDEDPPAEDPRDTR